MMTSSSEEGPMEPGATLVGIGTEKSKLGRSPYTFEGSYTMLDKLRSGSYGTVYVVKSKHRNHKKDDEGEVYAVKEIKRNVTGDVVRDRERDDSVLDEVTILYDLYHITKDGYTRLIDFYSTPSMYYVVQIFAEGGDVFDMLAKRKKYTEKDMRDLAKSFLSTLCILHEHRIIHRDLKPENLLLKEVNNDSSVLIADFGFARYVPESSFCTTKCGTPAFVAPEVLLGKPYTTHADMWSTGCLLYMLLGGYPPFTDKSHRGLFRKIKAGDYVFHTKTFKNASIEVKQLISSFLIVDPSYRCTARTAMKYSSWIQYMQDQTLSEHELSDSLSEIKTFVGKRKFKSAVHAVVFTQFTKFKVKSSQVKSTTTTTTATTEDPFQQQMKQWDEEEQKQESQRSEQQQQSNDDDDDDDSSSLISKNLAQHKFSDHYELLDHINDGSSGKVYKCRKRHGNDTTTIYAVKIIPTRKLNPDGKTYTSLGNEEAVLQEVSVMQNLTACKHIVRLHDFYEEDDNFYLIMDLLMGGDVFDRIIKINKYTEKDARDLTKIFLEAIEFMHAQGFAHRDLKPQNLLLTSDHDDADIKIADFGAAIRVHAPQSITTRCGTPTYVAPEILKNIPYDQSCDLWSVGIILHVLLCGYPPFMEDSQSVLFQKIRCGDWYFDPADFKEISDEAKDLIQGLLQVEPLKRVTATEALKSPWIQQADEKLSERDLPKALHAVKEKKSKFKNAAKSLIGMGFMKVKIAASERDSIKSTTDSNNEEENSRQSIPTGKVIYAGMKEQPQ